jgi:hypothetical protein
MDVQAVPRPIAGTGGNGGNGEQVESLSRRFLRWNDLAPDRPTMFQVILRSVRALEITEREFSSQKGTAHARASFSHEMDDRLPWIAAGGVLFSYRGPRARG